MGLYNVYYAKRDYQRQYWHNPSETPLPDIREIRNTHVAVNTLQAASLEDVYYRMQGERWNPPAELIRASGASHTSMSMGDVIYNIGTGEWFLCQAIGWKKLS